MAEQNNSNANNKQIAKNAIFMYIRMLLIMVVSLFTSRVVLKTLGQDDFGTYSIVGGTVVLFTFISNAMATGTQRHLSYELGKTDGNVTTIFSACLKIHIWLSLIILILAETVGLWFLNTKMNFPEGRMAVVNWIYQFSILACIIGIVKVPYNAAIIAYERMSFYAYSSVIEVVLKLIIVYLLLAIHGDKLFVYGALILVVTIIMFIWYVLFCKKNLNGIYIEKNTDKKLYTKLLLFSGWSLFGSMANIGYQQGVSIIINIFFGVGLNAAVGIATQVNSAVSNFVSNFQQALNPQLVQSEANNDRSRQLELIYKSSKFSFFIMLILSYPLMVNLDCILTLWLGDYPAHTKEICDLILVGVLITCLSGPLWVTIYATGKIRTYQIIVSCVALLILPIIYIGGRNGMTPEGMFFVRASNYIFVLLVQLYFLKRYISLDFTAFAKNVLLPTICVSCCCIVFYILFHQYLSNADSFLDLIWQTGIYVLITFFLIWIIGFSKGERVSIKNLLLNKIRK